MVLELTLVLVAIAVCYFACSTMVGSGAANGAGSARNRALELLAGDGGHAGDLGRAVQRPWRPGSWRALR